jgi:DNA-binding CsgD family transcriptional regulator
VRLLPAYIEITLAADKVEEARVACVELEKIAANLDTDIVSTMADHARGAIQLADGDARGALEPLHRAFTACHQIGAPYLAARLRVLIGLACDALGDADGAGIEFEAARAVFRELGAAPDLDRVDALTKSERPDHPHALTARELQVLRLVATGMINKTIAKRLSISEKTVHRHVSNIFIKIDVASRSAATAYAYEHKLV